MANILPDGFSNFLSRRLGTLFKSVTADPTIPSGSAALVHRSDTDKLRFVDATSGAGHYLAQEDTLASTANGKGASLIGLEDAPGLVTATTAEAAIIELAKKGNAGLAAPMTFEVTLSTLANSDVVARFTPGVAGKIRKISAFVRTVVTTSAKAATLTPYIAGTTVTGGALALTSANCTPKGAKIDGSAITAANAFGATDEITVVVSGVTTFVEGVVVICLFFDPAA